MPINSSDVSRKASFNREIFLHLGLDGCLLAGIYEGWYVCSVYVLPTPKKLEKILENLQIALGMNLHWTHTQGEYRTEHKVANTCHL